MLCLLKDINLRGKTVDAATASAIAALTTLAFGTLGAIFALGNRYGSLVTRLSNIERLVLMIVDRLLGKALRAGD